MPIPDIESCKNIAITVGHQTVVVLRDSDGNDIASVFVNDKFPSRARLVFKVAERINVRRETKT
jgi:hypothetical protein